MPPKIIATGAMFTISPVYLQKRLMPQMRQQCGKSGAFLGGNANRHRINRQQFAYKVFFVTQLSLGCIPSPCEFFVLDPFWFQGIGSEAAFFVFLVILEVAFKPLHVRFAFKGQDMCADPVEEEAIV